MVFSVYGLNMVGADVSIVPAYSALMPKRIMETIRNEKLTDFIITDDLAQINKILDFLFPIRVLLRKGKEFQVSPELRKAVLKYGNRLTSIPNGRVSIDHDFEE